jgi:hypothetical protein
MESERTRNEQGLIIAVADTHPGLKQDTTFNIL